MGNNSNIEICIIEDDVLILKSLKGVINNAEGFEVTGAFSSAEEALKDLENRKPDVLLLDIDLPGISGIEAIPQFKEIHPDLSIVMLTIHEEPEMVFSALRQGAVGYLIKGSNSQHLTHDIIDVYQGGAPMSPSIARQVIQSFNPNSESILSTRELEVIQKLSAGSNNKHIADDLYISTNTVKAHIKNIYKKLHVHTRAAAVSKAIKKGWI